MAGRLLNPSGLKVGLELGTKLRIFLRGQSIDSVVGWFRIVNKINAVVGYWEVWLEIRLGILLPPSVSQVVVLWSLLAGHIWCGLWVDVFWHRVWLGFSQHGVKFWSAVVG